jgi:hypothetical protein
MLTFFIFYFNTECARNQPSSLKEDVFHALVEEYALNVPLFIHFQQDNAFNSMLLEALLVLFSTLPLENTAKALTNQTFFNKLLQSTKYPSKTKIELKIFQTIIRKLSELSTEQSQTVACLF